MCFFNMLALQKGIIPCDWFFHKRGKSEHGPFQHKSVAAEKLLRRGFFSGITHKVHWCCAGPEVNNVSAFLNLLGFQCQEEPLGKVASLCRRGMQTPLSSSPSG